MPEPSTELPAGHCIGRYHVRRRLGAGGFARVYCAWDPDLEIDVAIKIPKPQLADDVEALDRFRREATTAARLRHPNVVTVLTVGKLEEPFDGAPAGAPYLVMDYLPESLTGRLAATPVLPEPEWLRIGEEVARGLAYAHTQGVVHRDVKPDNILFGRHGEAVVTDFGIARAVSERLAPTSRSLVVGTPEYFSPEQARGLPLDGRTDVYALGVTLYRMATGELPFAGDDWYAIMRQHVEDAPRSPRELNPALSEMAAQVIVRCLAKSPEDRFQTAAELAASLAATAHPLAAGVATSSDGATIDLGAFSRVTGPQPVRSARRRRLVIGGAAAVAVVGAIGAVLALGHRPTPPAAPAVPSPIFEPTTPPVIAAPPADSAQLATRLPESLPAPIVFSTKGSLHVDAPAGASIYLDGHIVGFGTVQKDSVTIGRHEIRATLPGADDCSAASQTQTVTVSPRQTRTVHLPLSQCGTLDFSNVTPLPARYRLSGAGRVLTGTIVPGLPPVTLPEGDYQLVIQARTCQVFTDTLHVQAGTKQVLPRTKLLCGTGQ